VRAPWGLPYSHDQRGPRAVLRCHRDHQERVKHADDGAGRAPNGSPFDGDFQKRRPTPASKKALKPRRCCLTFACVVRPAGASRLLPCRHAPVNPQGTGEVLQGPSDPKEVTPGTLIT
jgi:hypothetical protein